MPQEVSQETTQEINQEAALTKSAAERINLIAAKTHNKGKMLRVKVSGGGCKGFSYGFSFDDKIAKEDKVFEFHGAKMMVDKASLSLLKGSTIDFVEEVMGARFSIKIATWNVNSVRARLPSVTQWLANVKPDVVLLQELKCENKDFPALEIEDLGYNIAIFGQKSYNGVAILSKHPLADIVTKPFESQSRAKIGAKRAKSLATSSDG